MAKDERGAVALLATFRVYPNITRIELSVRFCASST